MSTFGAAALSRPFVEAVLNGVDVGIVTTDAAGQVTFVNRCGQTILRRDGTFERANVRDLLGLRRPPEALLDQPPDAPRLHTLVVGDQEIDVDLSVSRIEVGGRESGDAGGFSFVFHDRTNEKRLEMERRRFEHLAAMGTMVAGFAHEIRNPMASLRSLAESLSEELADARISMPHVDRMLAVIGRVERLVRTSLLFGRPSPPRPAAHRPRSLVAAAVSALLPRTRELGADFRLDAEAALPDVFVDDGQIVQVLVILLNNALDATGSPGRVALRTQQDRFASEARPSEGGRSRKSEPPGAFVRFDVRDDGRGIPPEIVDRIFDPFFTTKATGTGLGLSIAQQLVTENGGRIQVTSGVGGPTTFSLFVPISYDEPISLSRR